MPTILIALDQSSVTAVDLQEVSEAAPHFDLVVTTDRARMEALIHDVEIVAGDVPTDFVVRAPNLRWLQLWWAGAEKICNDFQAVTRPFVLTNVSGIHAITMAEHVLGTMIALARGFPGAYRDQMQRLWVRHPDQDDTVSEIYGKTALIVGLGAIGSRIAAVARALGMRVLGVRRDASRTDPNIERVVSLGQVQEVLPEADFVVLVLPLTGETYHVFGAKELGCMKRSAFLINVGRGATADESSLVATLKSGRIAGAALDVFEVEPLPEASPLWTLPNAIITPHYSSSSPTYDQRAMKVFLTNLRHYVAGQPLMNQVDKKLGY